MASAKADASPHATAAAAGLVEVAILGAGRGPQVLTYAVPAALQERTLQGVRVIVPLGSREVAGLVLRPAPATPSQSLREVLRLSDDPPIAEELLETVLWASRYYRAPLGLAAAQMIAPAARAGPRRRVLPTPLGTTTKASALPSTDLFGEPIAALADRLLARLPAAGLDERTLKREFGEGMGGALRQLLAQGCVRFESPEPAGAAVGDPAPRPLRARPTEGLRGRTQTEIHNFVLERSLHAVSRSEITRRFPGSSQSLARLIEKGALYEEDEPLASETPPPGRSPPRLRDEQRLAVEAINAAAGDFRSFLLFGVTGSGKTEIYLHAAAEVLQRGGGVLLLVPEIGLTPQLAEWASQRFPGRVAVLHSGLTMAERGRAWRRIAEGDCPVVVGARSAIFAPIPQLGLIVVDEEHDAAYKQEEAPRYHGRDLAIVRARNARCPIVLGSATPSLESWASAQAGRFELLRLAERANEAPLPKVEIVDLRAQQVPAQADPIDAALTPLLRDALVETYRAGEQSVIFLNRRGWSLLLHCDSCGHVERCPDCSVSLTLHRARHAGVCHHCGFSRPRPQTCSKCGVELRARGFGTEQLEALISTILPAARIARLDRDTGARAGHTARVVRAWRAGDLDVLVGTQMVTKGHDAPGVTLIGVVLADSSLHFPDFRANERTFQLLAQVAGRAGRGTRPGRVIVQTRHPEHASLVLAQAHDFEGFAAGEMRSREELGYPPFSRLVRILVEGPAAEVDAVADETAARLRQANATSDGPEGGIVVLGPAPAPLERLRGRDRRQLLIKSQDHRRLARLLDRAALEGRGETRVVVDIDPLSML